MHSTLALLHANAAPGCATIALRWPESAGELTHSGSTGAIPFHPSATPKRAYSRSVWLPERMAQTALEDPSPATDRATSSILCYMKLDLLRNQALHRGTMA
jgi:hypothetical protein